MDIYTPRSPLQRLLAVSVTDAQDARRRRLLNILLLAIAATTVAQMLLIGLAAAVAGHFLENTADLIPLGLAVLMALLVIFAINRYGSGRWAGLLFLAVVSAAILVADRPEEVVRGRSLFYLTLPILMASLLVHPAASMAMAGVLVGAIMFLAVQLTLPLPLLEASGLLAVAAVSWLSAHSMESAVSSLRAFSQKLDQHIAETTRELYQALAQVNAEAAKNQAILEGIADGVIVFDTSGRAMVANPAIGKLLGRPVDAIAGYDVRQLMDGQVDQSDQARIASLVRERQNHPGLRVRWGDRTHWVSFASVQGAPGAGLGTVAVFRDFTREAEVERMKSAFVSIVSHELRTPLGAILGYAEMLLEGIHGPLSDKQRNVTRRVMTNTKRLLGLVNDLLDQAQIEAGMLSLVPREFTAAELLDGLHEVMLAIAQAKGLQLTSQIMDGVPPRLVGDPQRLHQVLVNLVTNAIKFTDAGGVSVRLARPDAEHWSIDVSDTGRGIPAEAQAAIFEPFRQGDSSATRDHGGVGLGLSIVQQLITMMDGTIQLESRLGRGSRFTVVLPLTTELEPAG